jgi:hypothetical protein
MPGQLLVRPLLGGLASYVPGIRALIVDRRDGGTASAAYCYAVWLKHLVLLRRAGMTDVPDSVAELGPGGSLGVGLAALISGARHYHALDVVAHSNTQANLRVFDQLVALFERRAPHPDRGGWPDIEADLDERLFPGALLDEDRLRKALAPERIEALRDVLRGSRRDDLSINYESSWDAGDSSPEPPVDLVLSHSALEHVDDLAGTYAALRQRLRVGGHMSHQIDLTAHGTARQWNGFRSLPEPVWRIIRGRRDYLINRAPYSEHRRLLEDSGFEVLLDLKACRSDGVSRSQLTARWHGLTDVDLNCAGVFLIARRR